MSPRAHVALAALLLLAQDAAQGCSNVTSLSQQLDLLLAEYEREAPPARPALVDVMLDLRHAALRDDHTVHMLADLTMSWTDPRIGWNASEWGCSSVLASADRLWLPEVSLLNAAGAQTAAAPLSARLASDGRVSYLVRYDAAVPLRLDLAEWPLDVQTATFKFGSRTLTVDDLDLEMTKFQMVVVMAEAGAWQGVSMSGQLSRVPSSGGDADRRVALWTVQLRRRAAAHAAAARALLAAAALCWLAAAAMPPQARAPLCACASFIAALWLVSAAMRLPGSATAPRAVRAQCGVCAGAAAAALAAAAVARLAASAGRPPPALAALASKLSHWCKLLPEQETTAERGAWAALAQLLDYCLTAVLMITLFCYLCLYI